MRFTAIFGGLGLIFAGVQAQLVGRQAANCARDNCLRAVVASRAAALNSRGAADCASFLSTGGPTPTYASVCSNTARYSSACSCAGITAAPSPPSNGCATAFTCPGDGAATSYSDQCNQSGSFYTQYGLSITSGVAYTACARAACAFDANYAQYTSAGGHCTLYSRGQGLQVAATAAPGQDILVRYQPDA